MSGERRLTSRQTTFCPAPSPNKGQMTLDEMIKAAYQLGNGGKIRDVSHSTRRSPTSVHRVKQVAEGRVLFRAELNYDRVLLSHFVAFCLFENPMTTGSNISTMAQQIGLETSTSSVNRLARDMKFVSVFTQKQEQLTEQQKRYRVEFCRGIQLWFGFFLPWVFTDETMLVLNPTKKRVRIIRGVDSESKFIDVKGYPAKLMVWAAISRDFKSSLIRIRGGLTAIEYQNLLRENRIFELLNDRFGQSAYVFQQDGARPHTAKTTLQFLKANTEILPDRYHWPASSPDLNVIENLWAILKYEMRYDQIHDVDSMYNEAVRVWDQIPIDVVNKLMGDFLPRLRTCEAVAGECINRYKSVLRGFRQSLESGRAAMKEAIDTKEQIRQFKDQSRVFFTNRINNYRQWSNLSKQQEERDRQLQVDRDIGEESRLICTTLPQTIQKRCGLPACPSAVTRRVLVAEKLIE